MCKLTGQSRRPGNRTGWARVGGDWSADAGLTDSCTRSAIRLPAHASAPWRGIRISFGTRSALWRDTLSVIGVRKDLGTTIFVVLTHGSLRRCAPSDTPARAAASAPCLAITRTSSGTRSARWRGTRTSCTRSLYLQMGSTSSPARTTTSPRSGTPRPGPW